MGWRRNVPGVVLMCHQDDPIDAEGLSRWLAQSMDLRGIILLRDRPVSLWRKARREIRRVGLLRFLDVIAFRAYYRFCLARRDAAWIDHQVARLKKKYPADIGSVPTLVTDNPNGEPVQRFLCRLEPDLMVARCKHILKRGVFSLPSSGTFVLHPGICPEYRNAHGCFWALVNRDLYRVGMTLLRVDEGVDTGPIFLQVGCQFDEVHDSPVVIQYKVVLENLDAIAAALKSAWRGSNRALSVSGRRSAAWGQPWLSAYLRWKRVAREEVYA